MIYADINAKFSMAVSRVVVVEDDEVVREFVARCLGARGFSVSTAASGEEGLARIHEAPTAVVVTDIRMPGLDGFGLANALRRDAGLMQPDIIFMSSSEEKDLYRRALQLGGCDFLTKPFTSTEISEAVSARLASRAAQRVPEAAPAAGGAHAALPKVDGYRIIQRLGEGNASQVYLAAPVNSDTQVALKLLKLPSDLSFQRELIVRFHAEFAMLSKLAHPNVARVYEQGVSGDSFFLAMEYVPGGDLRLDIQAGMKPSAVRLRGAEIAAALTAIHAAGIVHRDLKPANVLMRMTGEAVLADFGIAKQISSGLSLTQADMTIGTPYYMSPEQATGGAIDPRSDQYGLGIVIYEMLTGQPPFVGSSGPEVLAQHLSAPVPRLPGHLAGFQSVIDQLLAKKPSERFIDAVQARFAILRVKV
jgi:CheY-like chemotaxis protein